MIPLWESRGLIGSLLDLLYEILTRFVLAVIDTGFVPDFALRKGIKFMCWLRLKELQQPSVELQQRCFMAFVGDLRRRPVAEQTHAPNQQHYEIPTEFYLFCLGRHMEYSSGLYRDCDPRVGLDNAEAAMLSLCCERRAGAPHEARLGDGQNILDLGCGWGSMALFAAASFPGSKITAVSSSKTHKEYIETRAKERSLRNLTVVVADLSTFAPPAPGTYDRIVSIELLCHLKNYEVFMGRAARWLAPEGLLFVQTVVHRAWPYHFEPRGEDDWLARHFATGATMPSEALLLHFQEAAAVEDQWALSGLHCALTAEDWLHNFDRNRPTIRLLFDRAYGPAQCGKWLVYWRLFFLACAETFAYNGGEEWYTAQYLFRRSKGAVGPPPEPLSLAPL